MTVTAWIDITLGIVIISMSVVALSFAHDADLRKKKRMKDDD